MSSGSGGNTVKGLWGSQSLINDIMQELEDDTVRHRIDNDSGTKCRVPSVYPSITYLHIPPYNEGSNPAHMQTPPPCVTEH